MQGLDDDAQSAGAKQISYALACADRHTGPSTTAISLDTQSMKDSLISIQGQPRPLMSHPTLANVHYLELGLTCYANVDDGSVRHFANMMLERLPNLTAASFQFSAFYSVPLYMPLEHLKHLELGLLDPGALHLMFFAELFPSLETACISAFEGCTIPVLDISVCRHLKQLALADIMVLSLSKLPQCRLRVEMMMMPIDELDASYLQQCLSEVNEVLCSGKELYSSQGLVAKACLPKLEVIRCDGWDASDADNDADYDDRLANAFVHCLRHSRNLPALKSILCGNYGSYSDTPMKACVPADLAGLQELMIATDQQLQLVFESAQNAGEALSTFCAVGSEIRVDAAALQDMSSALSKRGLTLSMAQAEQEHENAPSQCLYMRACSTPQLSYDEAIGAVNARVERWGRTGDGACGRCGACFTCLRQAGILDSK